MLNGRIHTIESETSFTLTCMYPNMYLLRTSRSERFAALPARKLPSGYAAMTMPVIHQRSTVREFFTAHIASDDFVSMRQHVPFQSSFVVESFGAFAAPVDFLFRVLPVVLE